MSRPQSPATTRRVAPAPLDLVQAFVNTRMITTEDPHAREDLSSPAAFDTWWRDHGDGMPLHASPDDLTMAIHLREGLRGSLARHNAAGLDIDAAAIQRLDDVAAALPLRAAFTEHPLPVVPNVTQPARQALAGLLARTVQARVDGTWERLKICRNPDCRAAFYDGSKNHSGAWCSMQLCGARAKQRSYVARRRQHKQGQG